MAESSHRDAEPGRNCVLCGTCLGDLEWEPESELWFSHGLPGFEGQTRFVPIEIPAQRPLVYLHSATAPSVCFLALPVQSIAAGLKVRLEPDDYHALGLDGSRDAIPGRDILCLTLLGPAEGGWIQANLSSLVVINLHNHRGHQLIPATGPNYWRLGDRGVWEAVCS